MLLESLTQSRRSEIEVAFGASNSDSRAADRRALSNLGYQISQDHDFLVIIMNRGVYCSFPVCPAASP